MGKYDDLDAFWDLGRIMPKKKKLITFNTTTTPKEHNIEGCDLSSSETKLTTSPIEGGFEQIEERSYVPERKGLIKEVAIIRWVDKYDFYGNFRKAAMLYYDYKTDKCDFAPYYSYMPQYSQLTSPQKQYYFYWRDMVRRGKFIKSDYSYLYLFVYEILNLPDKLHPTEGLRLLCELWKEYRDDLPKIDSSFAAWIQDYCLVHELNCPMEYISEFIFDVIRTSSFKEFYLSEIGNAGEAGTDAIIAYLSDYDFRKCKYRTPENKEAYTKYMLSAMSIVIFALMNRENPVYDSSKVATVERDAFPRSLCTHAVKCRLKIKYTPLSQDIKLRSIITTAVRYTENKLRAQLGVKSRLAIKDLPEEYKCLIDGYFDSLICEKNEKVKKENIPEYEALYDAPNEELSIIGADKIEQESWKTTARLVGDDVLEEDEILYSSVVTLHDDAGETLNESSSSSIGDNGDDEGKDDESTLRLSKNEISLIADIIEGRNCDFDLEKADMIERVNEVFVEKLGDIIIELDEDEYRVIEDYKEDVELWLSKIKK
jgi:hypothetical protein